MINDFNNKYCERTKLFTINLLKTLNSIHSSDTTRIILKQIIRSGTSVSANFRAASRARSKAEYYSKICIVVEECDETLYWLELLSKAGLIEKEKLFSVQNEATELLKIFSSTKKKLRESK